LSISNHIFLFPFTINDHSHNKNFMSDIDQKLKQNNWENIPFSPKGQDNTLLKNKNEAYSEYFYFHPFAQEAIFDTGRNADQAVMKYYSRKLEPQKKNYFKLSVLAGKEKKDYELSIKNIALRIYETQIGILSIELSNTKENELEDIIKINEFGKRIYPQYLGPGGIKDTKKSFLANGIEFVLNCNEWSESFDNTDHFRQNHIVIASYVLNLLGKKIFSSNPDDEDKYTIHPTIDDRMYVICWFGSNSYSCQFKHKHLYGKYVYESSPLWYRYIFHDGTDLFCQHDEMLKRLIKNTTYERWANYGTLYGISRYGLVCITDSEPMAQNVLKMHMRKQYAQMAHLLLAQRASILRFSQKVSVISGRIKEMETSDRGNQKKLKEIADDVGKLHADYIRFVNRMWFTEITPQEQGIEMYEKAITNMRLKEDMSDLKNEIKELHEYTSNALEKRTSHSMNTLTTLGAIFLPLTLLTGLLGMNVLFVDNGIFKFFIEKFSTNPFWINISASIISLVIFYFACFVTFFMARKYIKDIKTGDNDILSYLELRYLSFPWKKRSDVDDE